VSERAAFREIGVVEGFYGRVWSEAEREDFLVAIAPGGLNTYLYAPKHEPALGAALLEPLDKASAQRLHRLHHACEAHGAALWAGLHLEPPFDASQSAHLASLVRKALQLTQAGIRGIAVLLDDLPGTREGRPNDPYKGSLAAAQAHAVRTLRSGVNKRVAGMQWLLCPGRYTLDALLESAHGPFEPDYLARLHRELPPTLPWLWTGPQVCSARVSVDDLDAYLAAAGIGAGERPIVLWDNYPVNDAAQAGRLHLAPLAGRSPALPTRVRGYLFNPLLQPHLGALPGATCLAYANDPAGYEPAAAWRAALEARLPPGLHEPVTELAALTRTAEGVGGAAVAMAGVTGNLPLRLARAWDALTRGDPIEPYLLIDFRRVMSQLQQGLPAPLREEAQPWLGRLWRALRLFETSAERAPQEVIAPLRAEFAEWREEGPLPEVLGRWFP
jgi:hyaluronoglucosaminidase